MGTFLLGLFAWLLLSSSSASLSGRCWLSERGAAVND